MVIATQDVLFEDLSDDLLTIHHPPHFIRYIRDLLLVHKFVPLRKSGPVVLRGPGGDGTEGRVRFPGGSYVWSYRGDVHVVRVSRNCGRYAVVVNKFNSTPPSWLSDYNL